MKKNIFFHERKYFFSWKKINEGGLLFYRLGEWWIGGEGFLRC